MSVVERLLYIGWLVSPDVVFHASHAATKSSNLRFHHLRTLSATLWKIKNSLRVVTYLPSANQQLKVEAVSDASMQIKEGKTNIREGIINFRRNQNITHPISFVSRLARSIAQSTSTVKLLAAADAVYKLTNFEYLFQKIALEQTMGLILNSRLAFHLCSSQKELEKANNKIILLSVREKYCSGSVPTIRWTPS